MADNPEKPEDLSSTMEKLWGPRNDVGGGDMIIAAPRGAASGAGEDSDGPAAAAGEAPSSELERFRSHVDSALGHLAEKLAGIREHAVAAADARVAGAETRLLSRLDEIATGVAEAIQRSAVGHDLVARLEALEREAAGRPTSLKPRWDRVLAAVDVDGGAAQLAEGSTSIAALAAAVDTALIRLDTVEQHLARQMARASPRPDHVDLTTLRSELEAHLAGLLQTHRTELEQALDTGISENDVGPGALLPRREQPAGVPEDVNGVMADLVTKVDEAIERLTDRADAQTELWVALEGRVDQFDAALVHHAERTDAGVARIMAAKNDLGTAQEDLSRRLAQTADGLARIEEQLNQRLDRLMERAARADVFEDERLRSMEEQVHEAVGRITEAQESHRQEIQTGLREGFAGIQSASPGPAPVSDSRLDAVEERLRRSDEEMSELGEMHAALDVGLGALRSEIAEVRDAVRNESGDRANVEDHGQGRTKVRNADVGARLVAAIEAAEGLAGEQQQLKAQMATLAQASDAVSGRASSQYSASGPLRSDVRLLQQQLAAQNESLATLSRAVERLRRKLSADSGPKPTPKPRKN